MGDGINFNKMTFQQKVQQATQNLNAQQGRTNQPTTAEIINEIVRMAHAEKADNTLPEGYRIEHTAQTRRANEANNNSYEVYGVPNIPGLPDAPQDVSKFLDFIVELLPQINNLPPEIKDELIDILSEYVDKLENANPDVIIDTPVLYGTPVIDDMSQNVLKFVQKLSDMGVPSEVIAQIMDMLNECMNDPSKLGNLMVDIAELLHDAGLSNEQINEILNDSSLIEIQNPAVVYGTPDIPVDDPTGNVKKILDLLNKLSQLDLPPELMQSIAQELASIPSNQDPENLINILDNITEKINAAGLEDDKKAAAMQLISEFLNELNTDVITSICLYGTPVIPPVSSFREMIEKLLPDVSKLTDEWRTALASIVKNVITILKGFEIDDTGINTTTTGEKLTGTTKILVRSEADFWNLPEIAAKADKIEIVHKMSVMGRSGILIFFKEKE